MGINKYGQTSGTFFVTPWYNTNQVTTISSLSGVRSGGLSLETSVSTSLAAAATGTSGAGSMDANVKSTLSASYSSLTGVIA